MTAVKMVDDGVDAVRADGGLVHIRSLAETDAEAVNALHTHASDRSIYLRFFSPNRETAEPYVAKLTRPDSRDHHALAALVHGEIVGVASYERLEDDAAEIALIVADDRHHQGIGTLLLEHLAGAARQAGVRRFTADVLTENNEMNRVLSDLGFVITSVNDHGTAEVVFDIDPAERVITATEGRDSAADAASLTAILAPRSIAVIGVSDRPESIGHQVLGNILAGGFTGTVHVVNPHFPSILGTPSVPSPAALPSAPDLAIVAVPAARALGVVRACGERGTRAILLLTANFGEQGAAGKSVQDQILASAREYGMRLVGPNCVGVLNTDPAVRLNATFAALPLVPGNVGIVAQSGAFGIGFLVAAARAGLGVSQFVSDGNKADISGNDLLLRWERDADTRVIGMYLESLGDAERFARIARRVSRSKPILVVKSGRTDVGRRAGRSHTAAAASSDVAVEALFRSCGVLRMATMQDLLDAARVLSAQPLPVGPRVAIVGNSGGPGILAADAAVAAGLTVVDLGEQTQELLRSTARSSASTQNPVDLGTGVSRNEVEAAVRALLAAEEVDAVLTVFTAVGTASSQQIGSAIVAAAGESAKPIVATDVGNDAYSVPIPGTAFSLPVFTFPEAAATALAAAHRCARIRSGPTEPPTYPIGIRHAAARTLVEAALVSDKEWLDTDDVHRLLTLYGLPVCPQRVVTTADDAVRAAAELGYPVAAKLAGGAVHKSDVGGVRLGLGDEAALRYAVDQLDALTPPGTSPGVLVQPMAPAGTEFIVGVVREGRFDPLIMLGAGGILVDLLDDRTFRLAPLSEHDASSMIDDLRCARLLDGYRGAPVVSRDALADVVVRVAALATDLPEVTELDLNPVICTEEGLLVVDARVRVSAPPSRHDPLLRQLRRPTRPEGSTR